MKLVTIIFDRKISLVAFHHVLKPIIKNYIDMEYVFIVDKNTHDSAILKWYLDKKKYDSIIYMKDSYSGNTLFDIDVVLVSSFSGKNRKPNKIYRRIKNIADLYNETYYKECTVKTYVVRKIDHLINDPFGKHPYLIQANLDRPIYLYMKKVYNDEDIDIRVLLDELNQFNLTLAHNICLDGDLHRIDLFPKWVSMIRNYHRTI